MTNITQNVTGTIISNYRGVQERIKRAAESVDRDPTDITLIVVTKTHHFDLIEPLINCGHNHFGENRVQEADIKWSPKLAQYTDIKLHLIGHLQSNKVKRALELFDTIHSIDSLKLISEIEKNKGKINIKCQNLFLEINMANEEQKSGIAIERISNFQNFFLVNNEINCDGLMCIPPFDEEPSPYFLLLKKIGLRYGLSKLSMGMSADFEKAIQFGATHIRVGSEIFGKRNEY